ncbi:MAG: CHASE domain-containing protein [Beijerinckiaceae bacterium]
MLRGSGNSFGPDGPEALTGGLRRLAGRLASPIAAAALVVAAGAVLTFAAWRAVDQLDERAADDRFAYIVERFIDLLEQRQQVHAQTLSSGAALVTVLGDVRASQWRSIYEQLRIAERHPGVQGFGYAMVVQPHARAAHIEDMRAQGFLEYAIYPAGERETVTSIVYLEPYDWRNRRAHGYDMFSEPVRRLAMERARDTGGIASSARVTLVQETDTDVQPGFLLYAPIYGPLPDAPSVEDRRRTLRGFVYSPVRAVDFGTSLMARFENEAGPFLSVEVFDGAGGGPESLLFAARAQQAEAGARSREIAYVRFGHSWRLRLRALPAFERSLDTRARTAILFGGLAITALMGALAGVMVARQREHAANARTKDIIAREMSHRVKNLLSVIQSVASRSLADGRSLGEARQVFADRIAALARVHTALIDAQWTGALLGDLVHGELAPFGARVVMFGPRVRVNGQMSQHLAMAVHELATNAVKYGALSQPGGSVRVEWDVSERDGELWFSFAWREMGGPPVSKPIRDGFGQTLLRRLLGSAISAQPAIAYESSGLRYSFHCPLSRIGAIA